MHTEHSTVIILSGTIRLSWVTGHIVMMAEKRGLTSKNKAETLDGEAHKFINIRAWDTAETVCRCVNNFWREDGELYLFEVGAPLFTQWTAAEADDKRYGGPRNFRLISNSWKYYRIFLYIYIFLLVFWRGSLIVDEMCVYIHNKHLGCCPSIYKQRETGAVECFQLDEFHGRPINNNLSDMEASVYISVDRFILSAFDHQKISFSPPGQPATCILFPIFIDKNCCVVSTERERRTRACLFWQLSRLDGLSCSWTDIVSHGVALNSMQRTTAVCLIATSKLSADSSGTTPWRVFFKCFSLVFCFKSRVASTYLYQHYFYGRKNLFCFIWFCWLNRAPKWVPGVQLKKERNL